MFMQKVFQANNKETSKLRITSLLGRESSSGVRASNAESVSMSWLFKERYDLSIPSGPLY